MRSPFHLWQVLLKTIEEFMDPFGNDLSDFPVLFSVSSTTKETQEMLISVLASRTAAQASLLPAKMVTATAEALAAEEDNPPASSQRQQVASQSA